MNFKKAISCFSLALMIASTSSSTFANSEDLTDMSKEYESPVLSKEILESENYIIIDSEEKAKAVADEDLKTLKKERDKELSKIPSYIVKSYKEFEKSNLVGSVQMEESSLSLSTDAKLTKLSLEESLSSLKSKKLFDSNYTNSELSADFKNFYKKQKKNSYLKSETSLVYSNDIDTIDDSALESHITTLRTNSVEDNILAFFKASNYPVSYDTFLHSLTSSPKNLYYQTEGQQAYLGSFGTMNIAPAIKYGLLKNPGFLIKLQNFARAGYSELNQAGHSYIFNREDLAYSIHGTSGLRLHRMSYDRAYFRIWDVYDFASILKPLDYITSTSHYGITIEGLHHGYLR